MNVHVFRLLPLLEQAPDQIASRPLVTRSVTLVPVENDAVPLVPVATLIPLGDDVTRSPPRPVAVTVSVAVCGGAAGGLMVTPAVRVTPLELADTVTAVALLTVLVATLNVPTCAPAPTVTVAGTLATVVLLLESVTRVPPCGAAADRTTCPCTVPPPTRLGGLSETICSVGAGGWVTVGVTVTVAMRVVPL